MTKWIVSLFVLIILLPLTVSAHLDGYALENNGYRIELGQIPEDEIEVNQPASFTVGMEDAQGNRVLVSRAWIRLIKDERLLFGSTDYQTDDGIIDFNYVFQEAGDYYLTVRMDDVSQARLAEVVFPLKVKQGEVMEPALEPSGFDYVGAILLFVFSIALISLYLGNRKSLKK